MDVLKMQALTVGSPYENMKFINILDKLQSEIGSDYDWFVGILEKKISEIDELTVEKDELEKELSDMEDELDKKEKESDKLQDKVWELEDDVKQLTKELETLRSSKDEITSVVTPNEETTEVAEENAGAFREHIVMLRVRRDLEKTHELQKTIKDVSFDDRRILAKNCPSFHNAIIWYYNGTVLQSTIVKKTMYTRTLNKLKTASHIKLREIDYYYETY